MKKAERERFMRAAIAEARRGVRRGDGGPFGAVIVRNGTIVGRGHNRVVGTKDPTAHAEITALRQASRRLGRFHLADCEIFTTCEPCPMCRAALSWARIRRCTAGCTSGDAARIGFADAAIAAVLRRPPGPGGPSAKPFLREECLAVFRLWRQKKDRVRY